MELSFFTEARFYKYKGKIYTSTSSFSNSMWCRYLKVFDSITLFARIKNVSHLSDSFSLVGNDDIHFVELPNYVGPFEFVKVRHKVSAVIENNINNNNAFICRVPGLIGSLAVKILKSRNILYGVEVVGDPWDVFSFDSFKNPIYQFFRVNSYYKLRKIVKGASAVLYVTEKTLQRRYPVKYNVYSTFASNVQVNDEYYSKVPKILNEKEIYSIISIGSLEQMYKAPDIVIEAIALLKKKNIFIQLTWLGDGKYKKNMIDFSYKIGLSSQISFVGNVSSEKVRKYLSLSDIFVLVSRTEGLPRAIIEAMSMGLPCIGSKVGGIPELLKEDALVNKNSAKELADKIYSFIKEKSIANIHGKENLKEARKYNFSLLQSKREEFYNELKKISEE